MAAPGSILDDHTICRLGELLSRICATLRLITSWGWVGSAEGRAAVTAMGAWRLASCAG